jgi:hypothetical protein
VIRTRHPADHRSRARRWDDAVAELSKLQAEYDAWLQSLPENLQDTATAEALRANLDRGCARRLGVIAGMKKRPLSAEQRNTHGFAQVATKGVPFRCR